MSDLHSIESYNKYRIHSHCVPMSNSQEERETFNQIPRSERMLKSMWHLVKKRFFFKFKEELPMVNRRVNISLKLKKIFF